MNVIESRESPGRMESTHSIRESRYIAQHATVLEVPAARPSTRRQSEQSPGTCVALTPELQFQILWLILASSWSVRSGFRQRRRQGPVPARFEKT